MNLHFYNRIKKISVLRDDGLVNIEADDVQDIDTLIINDPCCQVLSVAMPVKQAKQIIRALPFALEEQLANDIDSNHIQYLGRQGVEASAIIVEHKYMEILTQQFNPHSVQFLPLLMPIIQQGISVCILDGVASIRYSEFGALSVQVEILTLTLEKLKSQDVNVIELYDLDGSHELLPLEIENLGYEINKPEIKQLISALQKNSSACTWSLLSGPYTRKKVQAQTKFSKLKTPLSLVAALLIVVFCAQLIQMKQYQQMSELVETASRDFYKTLFPGETIRSLRRQFKDKVDEAGSGAIASTSFVGLLNEATTSTKGMSGIEWDSVRYTRQKNELEINLIVDNVAQLDAIKQKMTGSGLNVDIASANNTGKRIKGILKVSKNG